MMNRFLNMMVLALAFVACDRQESMEELTARVFERAAVQFQQLDANVDSVMAVSADGMVYPRSLNEDGTLTQPYAFGAYTASGGGFWEIYQGGGTFAKGKNSIEDMPEIEL